MNHLAVLVTDGKYCSKFERYKLLALVMIDWNSLIFIVDDNKQVVTLIRKKLEDEGFTNLAFFDNYEDLFKALERKPRIIVLDNYLDAENSDSDVSLDAFEQVKELAPEAKIIVFSGETDSDIVHSFIFHGAYTYIVKNLEALDKLVEAIKHIVGL
jgi:DNA-binding NtrC family response regulator